MEEAPDQASPSYASCTTTAERHPDSISRKGPFGVSVMSVERSNHISSSANLPPIERRAPHLPTPGASRTVTANRATHQPTRRGPICVSVINMKGGVGKTTAVALLGRRAALKDLRVLVVDLDPQANLSQAYMGNAYRHFLRNQQPSIVEVFNGYQPPSGRRTSTTPLDPQDAVHDVYTADGTLAYIPSRFDFSDNLVRAVKPDPKVLSHFIADHFQDRDLVLIDCPPTESVFTRAAYHASRYVLVPVRPEYFATVGFPLLAQSLDSFRTENPAHRIDVLGVVINNGFYDGWGNGRRSGKKTGNARDSRGSRQKRLACL